MVSQMQQMKILSADASIPLYEPTNNDGFLSIFCDVIMSSQVELMMFASAMIGYILLFSNRVPKDLKRLKLKAKISEDEPAEDKTPLPQKFDALDECLRRALEKGDHRAVVRYWNASKQFPQKPSVRLSQVVESMQCAKKDSQFIVREVAAFLKKYPSECQTCNVNDILESLGKRLDSNLMDQIVATMKSLDLRQDERTYEIFLTMHSTTRSFSDVQRLVSEMRETGVKFSVRASLAVMKAALQTGKCGEAYGHFLQLKASWKNDGNWETSPWPVPRHIMAQLVELACREHRLAELLPGLQGVPVPEEAINEMLSTCASSDDTETARSVETLARAQKTPLADSTYSLLIKSLAGRPWRTKAIVDEVLQRDSSDISSDLAVSILHFCAKASNKELADTLLEQMKSKQMNVLNAFMRFYIETEQFSKACDVFEDHVLPLSEGDPHRRTMIDSRVERNLMNAALQCERSSLVQRLFDSSKNDVAKHVVMIRRCAAEKNLQGATSIFKLLKASGCELNSIVYNTMLDASVKCDDLVAAESWMKEIKDARMLDTVSFNTLMKAYLTRGNIAKARAIMEDMKRLNFQPNRVTFNELLHAAICHNARRSDIWDIVKEMKDAEVPPNQVTCSILLKNLNAKSSETDVLLTMDLIESVDEKTDEVLLSSIVEACVRIGKPDLLVKKLEDLQGKDCIVINGSHTCGSLIKAYGHAKDIEGVWRCWKDMRSRLIKPTSITLGCMVDAVVNNGDTEGAFDLVQQMLQDEQCRDTVNAIIYCSLLKGFTREKKLDRVWDVYEEMRKKHVEMSLITFNTIIDACARSGRMDQLPNVMVDMKSHFVDPNIVTYSTIIKGHCQAGDIRRGFAVLQDMRRETRLKPDEIMYNSLMDGCAQNSLLDEGLELFAEMQEEGIAPSNFTLSIMVKLLNRSKKVEEAFDLVREISQKYKIRPNLHVYTNLMQACISNRQPNRAFTILETMIKERVQPDCRTYSILIRSCFYHERCEQADALLRAALGLSGACELPDSRLAQCYTIDPALVNETLTTLVDRGCAKNLAAPLLADIKKSKLRVNIEQGTLRRVLSDEPKPQARIATKGKGRGQRSN